MNDSNQTLPERADRSPSNAAMATIERTLSSPGRLLVVMVAVASVLSWLSADQMGRAIESGDRWKQISVNMWPLFVPELAHFAMWAALAPALLALMLMSWRRLHPALFVLAQLATCLGVAWGMGWLDHHVTGRLRDAIGPIVREETNQPDGVPQGGGELESARPDQRPEPRPEPRPESRPEPRPEDGGGDRPPPPEELDPRGPERFSRGERGPSWADRAERMRRRGYFATATVDAQRRLPRELLLYLLVMGLSGSAFAFLQQRKSERVRLELEIAAKSLESELARSQLRSLRAQLQPHFLFNALHGIGGLVREGRESEALRTLSDLGGLLRRTLDADRVEHWSLGAELELVDDYLSVEGVRLGDRLTIERDIADDVRQVPLPPLLLLPIVENAIRHGIAAKMGPGHLSIRASRHGDRVRLEIVDNGPGYSSAVLAARRHPARDEVHVGLANTGERLERLFPGRHRFEIANDPQGGAIVTIELPIEAQP